MPIQKPYVRIIEERSEVAIGYSHTLMWAAQEL